MDFNEDKLIIKKTAVDPTPFHTKTAKLHISKRDKDRGYAV